MNLSRKQLYDMVWAEPVRTVAAKLSLSDVGLAKLCRRNSIPLPARGYWAKRAAGQAVTQTPLPNPDNDGHIYIDETRTTPPERKRVRDERAALIEAAKASIGVIPVSARLLCRHPLTKAAKKYFDSIPSRIRRYERQKRLPYFPSDFEWPPQEQFGRFHCPARDGFEMCVALQTVDRALRLLDALALSLEERGFTVSSEKRNEYCSVIEASKDGEGISFDLAESYSRRPRPADELKKEPYSNKYTYHANGRLRLSLRGRSSGESQWSDGQLSLEEQLPAIIAEFLAMVPRQKEDRARREAEQRAAEERQRREWLERQRREEELRVFNAALQESELLCRLEGLERYLTRVEAEYTHQYGSLPKAAVEWLALIRRVAEENHPMQPRLDALRDAEA